MSSSVAGQAALASVAAGALIVAMDWIPTPLNRNIRLIPARDRLPSTGVHATAGLAFAAANALRWKWAVFLGASWYTVVLAGAIMNWWTPYLLGVHRGEITPEIYTRLYAENLTVLPRIGNHPVVPDLQHTLIHLAVLAAAALGWRSFFAI